MTSALASKPEMLDIEVDSSLLDVLYRGRLMELRDRAEAEGFSKTGSVEVLRARLIQHLVLGEMDLSWEGIQSLTHKESGAVWNQIIRIPQRKEAATLVAPELRLSASEC